ncbi:MFS transporter [Paenibacillus tarimensis]
MNRLSIYLLALGAFLAGTAELVVAGILHIIADDMMISIALAGQLITAYSLAFAIGTPILVALTSRMSRKKLLASSLGLFIIGCLVSYWSPGYAVLMVSRIILGASAGVFIVVAISSAAKLVPADKMGSAIAMIALGFGSAMALGVPIGIAVADWSGWRMIFAGLGLVSLLVTAGLIRLLPQIEGDAAGSFKQQFMVLRNPVVVSGFVISLLLCMSNSIMLTYLTPFLLSVLHLQADNIGLMILILGIFGIFGSRLGGTSADKYGSVRMIAITLAASAVSLAFLPLFTALPFIGMALITVWFFSIFMNAPALQTYFIQQAPRSSNMVLGINTSIIHLGIAAGAGAGGLIAESTATVLHHSWIAGSIAALALMAAVFSFMIRKKVQSQIV